jgi:hypothetical protein
LFVAISFPFLASFLKGVKLYGSKHKIADTLQLEAARAELSRREQQRPRQLRPGEHAAIRALGSDLKGV